MSASHILDSSANTAVDWYYNCRLVCSKWVDRIRASGDGMVGGPGIHVEIDESLIYTHKYHAGRGPVRQIWVCGGVARDINGNNDIFIEQV